MKNRTEYRFAVELRDMSQGDEMAVGGYAALFNHKSQDLGGFKESIAPGAFTRSLKNNVDVKALFNHDPNMILGRVKNGTLSLAQDERGLKWRAVLDPTNTQHKDIHSSIKRGDIDECSFAFMVPPDGDQWTETNGNEDYFADRMLKDVDLLDVSAVTYPAYLGTNVSARCFEAGALMEVRSMVGKMKAKRTGKAPAETRDQSLEDYLQSLSCALREKFPLLDDAGQPCEPCCDYRFWICETYDEYVIVEEWKTGLYFKIQYHADDSNPGAFMFGDPEPVEQTWVPSERTKAVVAEKRHQLDGLIAQHKAAADAAAATAAAAQTESDAHKTVADAAQKIVDRKKACDDSDGNCDDEECDCQNCMADADEVWSLDDDDDSEEAKLRKAAWKVEQRAKGKVRTKTVGGKKLTADKFAFVGDPEKTATWKLPIHDADHVRNALARFDQTKGISADAKAGVWRKIKAAAKAFGITVSEENSRAIEAALPMDADEIADKLRRARVLMSA